MSSDAGSVRVEPCAKRVRAFLDGKPVADSRSTRLVWEIPHYPTYWFPADDVLVPLDTLGKRAALSSAEELRGLVRLDWSAMDEWFEEDEPVYVHPRDPYTRIDVLASSRHVRIEIDGVVVAESRQPRILFETSLPPRYYLPLTDVRMELLTPSTRQTQCPYKGTAEYWSVTVGGQTYPDLVWTYRMPLPESQKVAGLVCFYDERVDLYLDGELSVNR